MRIDATKLTHSRALLHAGEKAKIEVDQQQHEIVGDGRLDEVVLSRLPDSERKFSSAEQVKYLIEDPDGNVSRAQSLLDRGAAKVKVDVGLPDLWTMTRSSAFTVGAATLDVTDDRSRPYRAA